MFTDFMNNISTNTLSVIISLEVLKTIMKINISLKLTNQSYMMIGKDTAYHDGIELKINIVKFST